MKRNLENWIHSFSGCDGGSLNSDTWLCGIEWGYEKATENDRKKYYEYELPKEVAAGEVELNTDYDFFAEGSLGYPFNLAFAKMYAAIQKDKVANYNIRREPILKLNLSPIAFRQDCHSLWNDDLVTATGFFTKADFMNCINKGHRFSEIRKKYKPRLIVCIGNGRRESFSKGFFGDNKIQLERETLMPEKENKNQNNRYIYYAKHEGTLLVVTPFSTSPNGLNSDYLLQQAGNKIMELMQLNAN